MALYGAIEAGGTKFVCGVAGGPDDIRDTATFPTTTPAETLEAVCGYFADYQEKTGDKIDSIGVACFGPIDMNKASDKYGYITCTPKPGWQDTDVVGFLNSRFGVPVGFDTDVNAAAYGEYLWGAGKGLGVVLYLTVGTGIGGGSSVLSFRTSSTFTASRPRKTCSRLPNSAGFGFTPPSGTISTAR